jgi:hypothetical protein
MATETKSVKTSELDVFFTEIGTGKVIDAKLLKATTGGEQNLSGDVCTFNPGYNLNTGNGNPNADGAVYGFTQITNGNLRKLAPRVLGVGKEYTDDEIHKAVSDPKTAIKFMKAYLENELPNINKLLAGVTHDIKDVRAALVGSYNLGGAKNEIVIKQSIIGGKFNREAYYQNYFNQLTGIDATTENVNRVRRGAGDIATSVAYTKKKPDNTVLLTGSEASLETNLTYLSEVGDHYSAVDFPSLVIEENLGNLPWDKNNKLVVANPDLRRISTPAWFEVNLKQSGPQRLTSNGEVVRLKLNVSLQEIQVSMAHVVNNRHSRTGFHVTLWGQEPDTISATGTTGLFMNWFGITSIMSKEDVSGIYEAEIDKNFKIGMSKFAAPDGLRVAAQDAFIEMLGLFKNNGVTRFHPEIVNRIFPKNKRGGGSSVVGEASRTSPNEPMNPWSKAVGMSHTQATNRPNDVMTRGYVVFKYKSKTYLGYFKDIQFEMDANNPFRWNFNFTFQVEKSLASTFFLKSGYDGEGF